MPVRTHADDFTTLMPMLHRRARRLTRSADQAADLAQETALQVWTALEQGRQIDGLEPYAMRTLQNLARSAWRRQKPEDALPDTLPGTPPNAMARLICSDVKRAVRALPPAQASLMKLVAAGETSPATLAQMTGVPPGTVMSRLARARARLREDLDMTENDCTDGLQ